MVCKGSPDFKSGLLIKSLIEEDKSMKAMSRPSPWLWIPTLYFAEGIPYFLVNNISVMMFTRMGVSNGEMALFTSLLYLPWVIKPIWSPIVDVVRTKRWWIIAMQVLLTLCFVGLTLSIPHPDAATIASGHTPISLFAIMLIIFWVTAFASATHDIAADGFYMLALDEHRQSLFVGIRSTFYRISSIFGQGVLLTIAGILETRTGYIPLAWQLTLLICSVIFACITLWHNFFLPKVERTEAVKETGLGLIRCFSTFFRKKGIWLAMVFMLLYRLPEAFLIKILNPFFVQTAEQGGLGLATDQVGIAYGTFGVLCLTIGGILGGIYSSHFGLRRSLWLMALAISLPDAVYLLLSLFPTSNIVLITIAISVEQFGYGFGFTAYMLYMMYFSEGEYRTSHYALCTAFMALSMMLPGMVAGYLQEAVGYTTFFGIVMLCCLVTLVVTLLIYKQINPSYGKKQ